MNLKKIGKLFTSKFVGTGLSSYKKKNLPGRGLTEVEQHDLYWPCVVSHCCQGCTTVVADFVERNRVTVPTNLETLLFQLDNIFVSLQTGVCKRASS